MVGGPPSGRGDLEPTEGEKQPVGDILGIVGSARRWGNSELLVRQVLRGAQSEGAAAQMLRLTDLCLEPCTGCMRCAIGAKPCRLDDDMAWLIETLQAASGLVIAAPTYFLGPAAVVKQVLDRLLMVTGRVEGALPPSRPAITIATAGLEGWRGVTLPYLNALTAAFGYRPIDSLTAIAPGPGEVLLNEALMERVFIAGCRLGRGELKAASAPPNSGLEAASAPPNSGLETASAPPNSGLEAASAPPNTCPLCHCDAFTLNGKRATCPICGREATVEMDGDGIRLRFDPVGGTNHRWTPEGLRTHMVEWVQATGPRFLARRQEIKVKRRPYRAMEVGWLCPPSAEDR